MKSTVLNKKIVISLVKEISKKLEIKQPYLCFNANEFLSYCDDPDPTYTLRVATWKIGATALPENNAIAVYLENIRHKKWLPYIVLHELMHIVNSELSDGSFFNGVVNWAATDLNILIPMHFRKYTVLL